MFIIAGAEVINAMNEEKAAAVAKNELGHFRSEQLCALQRKQAGRGYIGVCIVKSIYGYSVRYDSGLQDFGLLRSARCGDGSFKQAAEFCIAWAARDPSRRYATF